MRKKFFAGSKTTGMLYLKSHGLRRGNPLGQKRFHKLGSRLIFVDHYEESLDDESYSVLVKNREKIDINTVSSVNLFSN